MCISQSFSRIRIDLFHGYKCLGASKSDDIFPLWKAVSCSVGLVCGIVISHWYRTVISDSRWILFIALIFICNFVLTSDYDFVIFVQIGIIYSYCSESRMVFVFVGT
jgi:hypothetical protein